MSSILKAIRKIEDDKRAQDNKAPDLMIDHGQSVPKSKTGIAPLAVGVVMGAVVVGLLSLMISFSEKVDQPQVSQTTQISPALSVIAEKKPVSEQSPAQDTVAEKDQVSAPVLVETVRARNIPAVTEKGVAQPEKPVAKASLAAVQQEMTPAKPFDTPPLATQVVVEATQAKKDTGLVVSEIFHQDDQTSSMAVVNDLPVMVGTYIGDVIVQAITKDSVTFQASGKSFTVPVNNP